MRNINLRHRYGAEFKVRFLNIFFGDRKVELNFEKYKIQSSLEGSSGKLSFRSSIDPDVI